MLVISWSVWAMFSSISYSSRIRADYTEASIPSISAPYDDRGVGAADRDQRARCIQLDPVNRPEMPV
jgi:hypothetical protein